MLKKILRRAVRVPGLTYLFRGVGGAIVAGIGFKLGEDIYRAVKKRTGSAPVEEDDRMGPQQGA